VAVTISPGGTGSADFGDILVTDPMLDAEKTVELFTDADGDGAPSPGDTLQYAVTITNMGSTAASGVTFKDTPDPNNTLIAGSVQTTQGTVISGNAAGDTSVEVDVGLMPAGSTVTVTFWATIDDTIPVGTTQLSNQGQVSSDQLPDEPTDDPNTPLEDDPTVIDATRSVPGLIVEIPRIDLGDVYDSGIDDWDTKVQVQNVGDDDTGVVAFFWPAYDGTCPDNDPGPSGLACMFMPEDGVWTLHNQIPPSSRSAIVYSVNAALFQDACEDAADADTTEE
jgi:uncharacterized repeat protein (TIGR01451 family)